MSPLSPESSRSQRKSSRVRKIFDDIAEVIGIPTPQQRMLADLKNSGRLKDYTDEELELVHLKINHRGVEGFLVRKISLNEFTQLPSMRFSLLEELQIWYEFLGKFTRLNTITSFLSNLRRISKSNSGPSI